jgi:hypothetical protein
LSSLENIQSDALSGATLNGVFLGAETRVCSKRKELYKDHPFRDIMLSIPVHYLLALRRNVLLPSSE